MRAYSLLVAAAALLISCGPAQQPATTSSPQPAAAPKPLDESHRFPKANLLDSKVVDKGLLGKAFMPGGTLARYRKNGRDYEIFAAQLPSPLDAAILLPDWKKALAGAKLEASFGGYFGDDQGRPVFVFVKGSWIAGIAGLPEKDADAQARVLAAELN